jgi:hypothetical protein
VFLNQVGENPKLVLSGGGFGMQVGAVAAGIHGEAEGAQFIDPIDGGVQFRKAALAAGGEEGHWRSEYVFNVVAAIPVINRELK